MPHAAVLALLNGPTKQAVAAALGGAAANLALSGLNPTLCYVDRIAYDDAAFQAGHWGGLRGMEASKPTRRRSPPLPCLLLPPACLLLTPLPHSYLPQRRPPRTRPSPRTEHVWRRPGAGAGLRQAHAPPGLVGDGQAEHALPRRHHLCAQVSAPCAAHKELWGACLPRFEDAAGRSVFEALRRLCMFSDDSPLLPARPFVRAAASAWPP